MSERSRPGEGAACKSAGRDFVNGSSPTAAEHPLAIPELPDDVDTLTAALPYAACGWYMLPVRRGAKNPGSVVGDHWHHQSSRDPKVITAWFAGTSHGIALHCGRSGAVVFDVDNPDKLPATLRKHLHVALYQSTRPDQPDRGHYVFAQPPGRTIGNSTGRLGNGWGEVRGLNGVIMAAPTPHLDGGLYRWLRAGCAPVLPDELADLLNDASPAEDAATDAQVAAFITEHNSAQRPKVIQGLVKAWTDKVGAGESRHDATVAATVGALKEAAAGYYPAQLVVDTFRPQFLEAVAKPPISSKQKKPRNGSAAHSEFDSIIAWGVAQALAANPDEVRARVNGKMPEGCETGAESPPPDEPPPDTDVHHSGEWEPGEPDWDWPRNDHDDTADSSGGGDPTTWEPVDLGPWLRGEAEHPEPAVGIPRSDGLQLIYPGREHAVLGETESGKTWFALGCAAAELVRGNHVVYIHYEEGDPGSTVERLGLLGVQATTVSRWLRFVAPARAAKPEWINALLDPAPTLVVHDGVNEGMSLHGADIMAADGASVFRRNLVVPFLRAGAASIACDHLPKDRDGRSRRDAYGSVHKGNALDGTRILLENKVPFGRRMRGVSYVFVTKDRPGQLRAHGRPSPDVPGKTFMGMFVVDDMTCGPDFFVRFFAPKDDQQPAGSDPAAGLADLVYDVIAALPDHTVATMGQLYAQMRKAGRQVRDKFVRDAVDDLIVTGRLTEVSGRRGAKGYRTVPTPAQESGL